MSAIADLFASLRFSVSFSLHITNTKMYYMMCVYDLHLIENGDMQRQKNCWTTRRQYTSGPSGNKPKEDLQKSPQLNPSHSNYAVRPSIHFLRETCSLNWESLNSNPPQVTGSTW